MIPNVSNIIRIINHISLFICQIYDTLGNLSAVGKKGGARNAVKRDTASKAIPAFWELKLWGQKQIRHQVMVATKSKHAIILVLLLTGVDI